MGETEINASTEITMPIIMNIKPYVVKNSIDDCARITKPYLLYEDV